MYECLSVNLFGLSITVQHVRVCLEKKEKKKQEKKQVLQLSTSPNNVL